MVVVLIEADTLRPIACCLLIFYNVRISVLVIITTARYTRTPENTSPLSLEALLMQCSKNI